MTSDKSELVPSSNGVSKLNGHRYIRWKLAVAFLLIIFLLGLVNTKNNLLEGFVAPADVVVRPSAVVAVEPPTFSAAIQSTTIQQPIELSQHIIKHVVPVEKGDYIHHNELTAPIVIESHKLIFFQIAKVATSNWKKLFLRMEGFEDWDRYSPHERGRKDLKFLHQYNISHATYLMNSPEYTRAIFVRDPKDRILSAYLDKVLQKELDNPCIPEKKTASLLGFLDLIRECPKGCCENNHWRPQSSRLDEKFFPKLDFIGHLETGYDDAKRLLEHIGAWEEFGQSGWGEFGNASFFARPDLSKGDKRHQTRASDKKAEYFTPQLETIVETMYEKDYSMLNLPIKKVVYSGV